MELLERGLAFASSGTGQTAWHEVWEAETLGCSCGDGATSHRVFQRSCPSRVAAPWGQTRVVPGGPRAGAQPGAVITPAAPSLVSWNRKSA